MYNYFVTCVEIVLLEILKLFYVWHDTIFTLKNSESIIHYIKWSSALLRLIMLCPWAKIRGTHSYFKYGCVYSWKAKLIFSHQDILVTYVCKKANKLGQLIVNLGQYYGTVKNWILKDNHFLSFHKGRL